MNKETTNEDLAQRYYSPLLGTKWRHKKKGGIYLLTKTDDRGNMYLQSETKGCRSTWKYTGLLPWDYEQVPNAEITDAGPVTQDSTQRDTRRSSASDG